MDSEDLVFVYGSKFRFSTCGLVLKGSPLCGEKITGSSSLNYESKRTKYQIRSLCLSLDVGLINDIHCYSGQKWEAECCGVMRITAATGLPEVIRYNT